MTRRTYDQTCGIARALDLLGERWTLLIVRDLLVGPLRYTDLLEGLPGIGTNLLADRLKRLEAEGIVTRHPLPEPADSVTVYDLTPAGRDLEPVLQALARWSWRHLGAARSDQHADPRWTALALRAAFDREAARGVNGSYEFEISGRKLWARVQDGVVESGTGPAEDPVVVLRSDDRTLSRIRAGEIDVAGARASGNLRLEGQAPEVDRMLAIFSRG